MAARVVEGYKKAGRIGYHMSPLMLVTGLMPDYDVSFSIIISGPSVPGEHMADLLGGALVPALAEAGMKDAERAYAGLYEDGARNSSLVLTR